MNKINANTVLNLLLQRHSKDICVPECKNGPTWTSNNVSRFDLWAMKKSYTKPMTWIYEIKVSRQDFLKDDKWQGYLKYCTDFYFAAPVGIIDVSEVPEQAGLLLMSKTGGKLYCKKKAPHRDITVPDRVFKYILMSRSQIVRNADKRQSKKLYWKQWLTNKNENQKLGRNVSRKIRQMYDKDVEFVVLNQNKLEMRIEKLENAKRILKELGFDGDNLGYNYEQKIQKRIAEINAGFPEKDVISHLEEAISNLNNTISVIKKGA